ncbi:MAG: hypothetical protein V4574_18040 [Pseudomonadota bacterium]
MRLFQGLAAAAMLALPMAAAAQDIEDDPARMCSATGAFGETFGSTRLAGKLRYETDFSLYFTPRKRYPPFVQSHESYNAGVTANGRRIFRVTTSVFYPKKEVAADAYRLIGSQIVAGGWTTASEKDGTIVFASDAANPQGGIHVELQLMGSRVFMECIDTSLLEAVQEEAWGPPPPVAKRPEPPARPPIPVLPPESDCAVPERRAAFVAAVVPLVRELQDYSQPALQYAEKLAEWKAGQLVALGVWTDADRTRFAAALFADPAFARGADDSLSHFQDMLGFAVASDEAERRGDAAGRCVGDVRMLGALAGLIEAVEAHWGVVDDAYAREAARLGVVLE